MYLGGLAVSKLQLVLTSLIAAIPGAFLSYLLVMTFVNRAGEMPGTLLGLAGLTLASSVTVALLPVAIAVFVSSGPAKPQKKKPQKEEAEEEDFEDEEAAEFDEDLEVAAATDVDDAVEHDDELEVDDEFATEELSDEIGVTAAGESEDEDIFGEDDEFTVADEDEDEVFAASDDELDFDFEDEEEDDEKKG